LVPIEGEDDILGDVMKSLEHSKLDDEDPNNLQRFHNSMLEAAFPDAHGEAEDVAVPAPAAPSQAERAIGLPQLELREAEEMLERFKKLTHQFPFVVLPESWTLATLLKDRPFLALGIFSVMSNTNLALQRLLVTKFRKSISERLIVGGEKSLDLLQGLLVHLGWYVYSATFWLQD
jgi:hypothetical protein